MATFVSFLDLKTGVAFDVNVADPNVSNLRTVPDSVLNPLGIATGLGTYIEYDTGQRIAVRGTLAATAALFVGGGVAPSKAVYVDTAGNDSTGQRGSAVFPFLTMAAAMAVVQSGDEVLVSPGTYAGAFALPAVANITIRGSGEYAGDTVLTAANAVDVMTLNAANRSVLVDTIQIAGLTTGRAIVGTGAAAARAWLSTGAGLALQDVVLSSAAGNALDLTYANLVLLRDTIISSGGINLTVCSAVVMQNVTGGSTVLYSWDEADALRPTAGQGQLSVFAGCIIGVVTLAGLQGVGPVLTGGSPKLLAMAGSSLGGLTGLNLGDNAAAHLSIIVHGEVGAVDFQSTAAKQLPDTATALVLDFQGAVLTASGASAMLFKVGGAAANAQIVHAEGLLSKAASTFTADVKVSLILKGAGLFTPTYSTPGATGDILPPYLAGVVDIAAGGALAKTWANLGHASLVRVTSTSYVANVTSNIQAADAVVPIAGKVATGLTITSTAQAGNTAANVEVLWIV
jgi:hypothetical protein